MNNPYPHLTHFKTPRDFFAYIQKLELKIPVDEQLLSGPLSPLAQPYHLKNGAKIGNRFCVLPMEGWDGTNDGNPTDLVFRRWKNFGKSGAKLIWGGEAFAVRPEGRANPNQLMLLDQTMENVEKLKQALIDEHYSYYGQKDDLFVGIQLTHSGRFSRPNLKNKLEPKIAYHHPLLDTIFQIPEDYPQMTDGEIDDLIDDYVKAAKRAQTIGFNFIDIKHCHGYFGHELLSAITRKGKYGGSFENRTRFLKNIIQGIQTECPGLVLGVRVSAFDMPPFLPDENNIGHMMEYEDENGAYPYAFGGDPENPGKVKLDETIQLLCLMEEMGVELVNFSAASPYYNPHLTRPFYYPPSDGYLPPEDPIVGVARHIEVSATLKSSTTKLACIGSGYSYLQEFIPHVAQAVVRLNMIDFVGLGRSMLSYPQLPADILSGKPLDRKIICRTFSDCTTAPRKGFVSGCYPLDDFYKNLPEAEQMRKLKRKQ